MPPSVLPSLATKLKLAREAKASLLVSGSYEILPEKEEVAASVTVRARIIKVNEGRILSDKLPDGRRINREINLTDALGNLQSVQDSWPIRSSTKGTRPCRLDLTIYRNGQQSSGKGV